MAVHALTRYQSRFYRPFHVLPERLPDDEIETIVTLGRSLPMEVAVIAPSDGPIHLDASFRGARVSWIHPGRDTDDLLARFGTWIEEANEKGFGFDLLGFAEPIQFTEYEAPSAGYDWHVDLTPGPAQLQRKLSLTVQLSGPDEYEGGDLEFSEGTAILSAPKERGLAVAFPSFQPHRVTPVTRGLRRSLVIWIGGPSFR